MDTETLVKNDAELARLLDVDRAVVCRDKKRGMPTYSLEAAVAWRRRNLNIAMRKDSNPARDWYVARHPESTAAARRALEIVDKLMQAADILLSIEMMHLVETPLREAIGAIPRSAASRFRVAPAVMDVLTKDVRREIQAVKNEQNAADDTGDPMTQQELDEFWLDVAAGRVVARGVS